MAFESFHSAVVPEPKYVVCEGEGALYSTYQGVFGGAPTLQLVDASINKDWLSALTKITVRNVDKLLHYLSIFYIHLLQ